MPNRNPVHYNTGTTLNNSISRNQMSFGVENVDYGPTINTGWYANAIIDGIIIVSDSYSQGVTTQENAYPIFWGTTGTTDIAIMSLINGLPARSGLTPFIDPGDAMNWIQNEGVYGILNRTYESIVVSGLALLYDAGTTLSYPLIGTQIYDLTSGNNNGTLLNGVTYLNSNGGVLNFNSSSQQYITYSDLGTLSEFTVGCWFSLTGSPVSSEYPALVTDSYGSSNVNYTIGVINTPWTGEITGGFYNTQWYTTTGFTPNLGQWYYVVTTYDGSTLKLYVDGVLYSQVNVSANPTSSGLGGNIGKNWSSPFFINGQIGIVQIYNRALSDSEVYTNMSAQAGRYSIPVPTPTPTPTATPAVTPQTTPTSTPTHTPTPSVTPTHTITQTPSVTQTITPTVTQTNTPTLSVTPTTTLTPSLTPSPTPIISFSGDSIMFVDSNKSIYKYDPNTNLITYLFDTTITGQVLDIAVTDDKIFVNDNLGNIYKYDYASSPFVASFSQSYSFSGYVGSGMTAIDNNTLLIASENVYRINLTTSQVDLMFSLSATCVDCITNGDILYNSTLNQYAISYINTGTSMNYATVFDGSGNTITTLNLQSFSGTEYTDLTNIRGLYVYNTLIYGMTYDLYLYNLQFSMLSVSGKLEPSNKSTQKSVGCSSISSTPSWGELPPYFEYE